jgi:putative ABC transport system permease protein
MDWTTYIRTALSGAPGGPDDDVVEELRQHAGTAVEAARAEGLTAAEAETRVRLQVDRWCADPRVSGRRPRRAPVVEAPASGSHGSSGFAQDVRYGLRLLLRQPGFTLVAVVVTALGIGATTTLFSVAYGVLRRPLPWPEPDRLIQVSESREGETRHFTNILTNATFLAWRTQPTTIESLAAWSSRNATITSDGHADRVTIVSTTASLFDVLKSRTAIGHAFSAADEVEAGSNVAVVSFGLWQRYFGGQPDVIDRTLDLVDRPYRVVGVMGRDFEFPDRETQVWIPHFVAPVLGADGLSRSVSLMRAIARLRPGVTAEQAATEGTARGHAAPELGMVGIAMFGSRGAPTIAAASYLDGITSNVKPALTLLFAAVILLLVTGIANIAGLEVARATSRRREVAIRAALGAGTGRLARQLLTESTLLGVVGGLAGLALTYCLHIVLPSLLPASFPRIDAVFIDARVLGFAMGATLMAGVVVGLLPALMTRRLNLVGTLVEDSLAPVGGGRRSSIGRARVLIMTGQVAMTAVLLIGASLLSRSFIAMLAVDRGYEPRNLLTATLPLPTRSFTGPQRASLLDTVLARLAHVPSVRAAALSNVLPLMNGDMVMGFQIRSPRKKAGVTDVHAALRIVSPGYFDALGMHIVEGRALAESDTRTSLPALVVNREFARTYLDGSALGVRIPLSAHDDRAWEIVGVVDNVKQRDATDAPQPEIFETYRQVAEGVETDTSLIVVRSTVDPRALVPVLRGIVREQNPTLALDGVMTMEERLSSSLAQPRLYAVVLSGFAGFAVLIAGVGLFGVLSHNVAQRSREIGVRAALGARPADIIVLVLRQGIGTTSAGLIVGLAAAFLLARYAGTLLFGVSARDPFSFVGVSALLLAVALVACYIPARRAAKVDPLKALRAS